MESLLVVTNTEAASTNEDTVREAVEIMQTKADVQVCRMSMPGDLDGVLHLRGGRTVVVAGGDGSLHTVVTALHRRNELADTLLAVLPLGSANAFARSTGVPLDSAEAARTVLTGVERRLDLLTDCRGDVVVNSVRVLARERGRGPRPRPRRRRPGWRRAHRWAGPALRLRVEADGEVLADFDRTVAAVEVGHDQTEPSEPSEQSQQTEPSEPEGARREAAPGGPEGSARVLVRYADRGTRGRLTGRTRGRVSGSASGAEEPTVLRHARKIQVVGQRFWLDADGEISGPEQRRTWQAAPARLRMILPEWSA